MVPEKSDLQIHTRQTGERLVYFVSRDQSLVATFSQQLAHFGYYLQPFGDLNGLTRAIADHHAEAVFIDVPMDGRGEVAEAFFLDISRFHQIASPIIFISDKDDQDVRLNAIRAGGVAFFSKPVDIGSLIDQLDAIRGSKSPVKPYHVLIIDDQATVASYYQMVLKLADMHARVVTEASDVLNAVRDFHPDLILLDIFMPEVNGIELAKVIRQIDEFVSIPIIFLSTEDDFNKRIEALDLGGDDFLIKPIKASHLIAVVRSRLERLRTLRSYMVHDSLTNLLNHTSFRVVLAREVTRCKRQGGNLALAMMDLDHFKQVNDTYGHATGDAVLKTLSRLLRQRVRENDIVGRYGGEEFVILFIDCDAENARKIMNEIRTHFSSLEFHPTEDTTLSVTFSCGISTFPAYEDAKYLSDAADQALYAAKANGRDQVVIISPRGESPDGGDLGIASG
jgi:diguanylate cyclase (GGDEF)-like protein